MESMFDPDMRDVYDAEYRFRELLKDTGKWVKVDGLMVTVPEEIWFKRFTHIQPYVTQILEHIGHGVPCGVRVNSNPEWAFYYRDEQAMAIPDYAEALRESVVLHELAHHITPVYGHGRQFRDTLAGLIEKVMGYEARLLLQDQYLRKGLSDV